MSEELLEPDADKRMKAEEFADYYEARDEGKRLYQQRKRKARGGELSWAIKDLTQAINTSPRAATVGLREDGVFMLYRGCDHVVYGNSYAGKTWFALTIAAQQLNAGHRVFYIDFEDDEVGVLHRLLLLGVDQDMLVGPEKLFDYIRPVTSFEADAEEMAEYEALLSREYHLGIIDGMTEAMDIDGLNSNVGGDVANWQMRVSRRLATEANAAVVILDHVTNDPAHGGRPIGSERKITGISGAAYWMVSRDPLLDGKIGCSDLRISKDRHGDVNKHGVDYDQKTRTLKIASFELDSTQEAVAEQGHSVARITVPTAAPDPTETDEARELKKRKHRTWHMERVSRWFEDTVPHGETRSKQVVIKEMMTERMEAKRPKGRDCWREAIEFLVGEGHLIAGGTDVNGKSADLKFTKPYRQKDDSLSDSYKPHGDVDVTNWKVKYRDDGENNGGAT